MAADPGGQPAPPNPASQLLAQGLVTDKRCCQLDYFHLSIARKLRVFSIN